MCGIVGCLDRSGERINAETLHRMTTTLRHRGPDDEGYVFVNTQNAETEQRRGTDSIAPLVARPIEEALDARYDLAFGFRRLSIIDLTAAGHQPMQADDGRVWIVYNGEIYNYRELRRELQSLGHVFQSASDTEVLLKAYLEWGYECLSKINGMWAFCIWDSRIKRLFCARDRFGVKPFYYYFDRELFIFASEIKAIIQHPRIQREANPAVIYSFLVFSNVDNEEATFFKGIRQLLPGHFLILSADTMELRAARYWSLTYNPDLGDWNGNGGPNAERFLDLFRDAVRLRLRADVPVGTCLSGGLDSSSITCMVNRLIQDEYGINKTVIGEHQKTFTSAFEDPQFDERDYVRAVLAHTGAKEHYVFTTPQALWEELPDLAWHQDEPFASTSVYAQWNVMRLARQNDVTVLLDGQGADEILAGYRSYFGVFFTELILNGRFLRLFGEMKGARSNTDLAYADLVRLCAQAGYAYLPVWMKSFIRTRARLTLKVLGRDFKHSFAGRASEWQRPNDSSGLQSALFSDFLKSNLPSLLRYEDRNSMAFSIEARLPFLDYRLVEFLFSLPASEKIRRGQSKYILRQAIKGLVPEPIRQRRDKKGFVTPHVDWMRQSNEQLRGLFSSDDFRSASFVDRNKVLNLIDRAPTKSTIISMEFWRLVSLEIWMRRFGLR
jgi:asparagine synthase (glutamine-hydrolysing)